MSGTGVVFEERQRFRDVISPKLGIEAAVTNWLLVRGGYAYRTSAVPNQDGRTTNLIGGPKHLFTIGAGLVYEPAPPAPTKAEGAGEATGEAAAAGEAAGEERPAERPGTAFDLDLFAQFHWHPTVSARKDASDPIGDWEAGGLVLNLGFTVTVRF